MSRGLWFAAGAGAAVYTMARARRAAEVLTPDGLSDRLAAWSHGARIFRDEVAQGRSEAETQLRDRLAVRPAGGTHRAELGPAPGSTGRTDTTGTPPPEDPRPDPEPAPEEGP